MVHFYYQANWRRFVVISSGSDNYRAGAETVLDNIKQQEQMGFKIVHHYDDVNIASEHERAAVLEGIVHEARSK